MNTRIKEVRNALKLSRDEFGEKLGVSRDVIANIELDRLANPKQKEPLIRLICEKFNINYEWLTTGQGEMYIETKTSFVERLSAEFGMSFYAQKIVECYLNLDDSQKGAVDCFIKSIAESVGEPSAAEAPSISVVDKAIEKIPVYRAAHSEENKEHEIIEESPDEIARLKSLPKVTSLDEI